MRFRRDAVSSDLSINITPLIDVVFLLLIFFMVTARFDRETALEIDLPGAEAPASESAPARIDVALDRDGNYRVNDRPLPDRRLSTLIGALEREAGGNHDLPVLLAADAEATHQSVVAAMTAIGRAGFASLQIAVREIPAD